MYLEGLMLNRLRALYRANILDIHHIAHIVDCGTSPKHPRTYSYKPRTLPHKASHPLLLTHKAESCLKMDQNSTLSISIDVTRAISKATAATKIHRRNLEHLLRAFLEDEPASSASEHPEHALKNIYIEQLELYRTAFALTTIMMTELTYERANNILPDWTTSIVRSMPFLGRLTIKLHKLSGLAGECPAMEHFHDPPFFHATDQCPDDCGCETPWPLNEDYVHDWEEEPGLRRTEMDEKERRGVFEELLEEGKEWDAMLQDIEEAMNEVLYGYS